MEKAQVLQNKINTLTRENVALEKTDGEQREYIVKLERYILEKIVK